MKRPVVTPLIVIVPGPETLGAASARAAAEDSAPAHKPGTCPACSHAGSKPYSERPGLSRVRECLKCAAVYGDCYLGDSYQIVLPLFVTEQPDPSAWRYYDLSCVGSDGPTRRHGYFDPATKRIVQVG